MGTRKQDGKSGCCNSFPTRYVLTLLGFLTITSIYSHRVVMNVAIVAMVNNTEIDIEENSTFSQECVNTSPKVQNATDSDKEGTFNWSQTTQGIILGSFYYGYTFSQFLGGWITYRFGAKRVLIITFLISSLMVILTPLAAQLHVAAISSLRVMIGLAQGVTYPAVYTLFAKWAPAQERSTLVSACTCGNQIGTILAMSLTGFLSEYGFAGGWPSAFYVLGMAGCVLCVVLVGLIYDSPSEHPRISMTEYEYIRKNISDTSLSSEDTPKIPWKNILTSGPVWAVAIAKTSWSWGFYTLLSKLPSYLSNVLHFPIEENGLINAFVYISNSFSLILSGYLSDVIMKKKWLGRSTIRKICETIGLLGPAICLAFIPYMGCNSFMVIVMLTLSMGLFGFIGGGDMVVVVDLAPKFAGTIFGITNGMACLPGFLAPYVAGVLLDKNQGSMIQWSYIFYISSSFYIFGAIAFLILGSAELQPWATSEKIENEKIKISTIDECLTAKHEFLQMSETKLEN